MRRVLIVIGLTAVLLLASCGGDDDASSPSSTTTTTAAAKRGTTTTRPGAATTEDPRFGPFCEVVGRFAVTFAALDQSTLEGLRQGAADVVALTNDLVEAAPPRLLEPSTLLRDTATQMQAQVDAAPTLEEAVPKLVALQTQEVEEATTRLTRFDENQCPE